MTTVEPRDRAGDDENNASPPLLGLISTLERGVEQGQFGSVGSLENGQPPVEVGASDRGAVPRWLRVPGLDPPPELVGGHVEEVQFDADTDATSRGSHLVTFDPRPKPEIDDDAQTEAQDLLGEAPELRFNLLPSRDIPRGGTEGPEPLILGQTYGVAVPGELLREHGLSRPGQPAGENQSGFAHSA